MNIVFRGIVSIGFLLAAIPAGAEEASSKIETTLKEVVVTASKQKTTTASKTDTPLRDIPASVTIIPRELIDVQAATNVDNTIRNVSGVVQSGNSNYGFFNNYSIRGLNMNFLRDGVPDATTINGYSRSLTDVEQIEVLKGPGSALYGSGAPGGSVNLVSKSPQEEPQYTVAQAFGSFQTSQTSMDLTGPTGKDNLLYRFNANYYTTQGFRDLNKKTTEVLPTFLWRPSDDHQVTVDFDYRKLEVMSDTYGTPFQGTSLTQENHLLGVPRENKYYTPFSTTEQEIFRGAITDESQLTDRVLLRNNFVMLDRNLYLLRNSGGAVAAGSSVMTGRALRQQSDDVEDYLYQLEPVVDFHTGSVAHKLLSGFETQYHDMDAKRSTANLPNITDVFHPVIPESTKSNLTFTPNFDRTIRAFYTSVYMQDQVELNEQWKVRMGGRSDWFDTRTKSHLNNVEEKRRDNELSGQAGIVYQPWRNTSFYSGASSSKQAILSTESASPLNKPESADQIEVGTKTTFFDEKLSFNVALYDVTRKDFLVTIGSDTIPIGEQRSQGVELDVTSEPVRGWKLNANYAYQDAKLTNVPQAAPNPSVYGNRPIGIPVNTAGLWTTYEWQNGRLKGFGVGGGLTYKGSVYINLQNTSPIPGYVVGDLVAFYRKDWYETQLNISNIGDITYYRNGLNGGALPGDPLMVQATVKAHF